MKKVIETFKPQGGKHCITTSLKQVFDFYGYSLSEEMLFGIGEGLDFTYINLAAAPMVAGRSKVIEFEENLAKGLGITIRVKQSKDYGKVLKKTKQMIEGGHPVMAYVDMPFISYLGLDDNSHFGGHSIVLFGYDDEQECFYVSDRDNSDYSMRTPNGPIHEDYHLVPYREMQAARSSNYRPFPPNNKYVELDFSGFRGINRENLTASILDVCQKMLNPPATLKGVSGIQKFSKDVKKWVKFDDDKLKRAGTTNYFMINADGGTGGGIFRKMYGVFLNEAAGIFQKDTVNQIGNQYIELSGEWDIVGDTMWQLQQTGEQELLEVMSKRILQLYHMEVDLMTRLQREIS
ncbi:BtrH N-terminal domain-containing protein [Alkaliphilus peptidifermentans]|uniref:Butirosin biosynthesis protein H, N-terminal n=1 Tax=Alkaliphilus peptidifermentans DSM 18978 TaxID=1120976 RepID=A0A1G5ILM7_9FIRM|nr:BtrH N-terminal domain-containing protein [Alkaliphilus peptidifermentans]SCY76844.1 Butirosin biosynthesis protein H, N-terminal [Alkaliphilus peptidifermentans DSM 18978]